MTDTPTIVFDRLRGTVTSGDLCASITQQQSEILLTLAREDGRVVAFQRIMARINSAADLNHLSVQVHHLRARLRPIGLGRLVETAYGRGYFLSAAVQVVPPSDAVWISAHAGSLLRELLKRCADRPADAELAERVRLAVF